MMSIRKAVISKVLEERNDLQEVEVTFPDGNKGKATVYLKITGEVSIGDQVLLNTTAVELKLGTGGVHFVQSIIGKEVRSISGVGHIMKLRYTPWQLRCLAVEEEASPYHQDLQSFQSLGGVPVVAATLHSMLPLVAVGFLERLGRPAHITYIMTDGAALPIAFSRTVAELKKKGILNQTITAGHSFGGDLEAITVPSALVAASVIGKADFIIVAMGPGIVGSNTKYGFTGLEQAHILEDIQRLGGTPIAVPRVSSADPRERHRGLSHHSRTVLGEMTFAKAWVPLPENKAWTESLQHEFQVSGIAEKHRIRKVSMPDVNQVLDKFGLRVTSMGRDSRQDPAFFASSMAAGVLAAEMLLDHRGFSGEEE
ncbi:MAG TPA: DUF3866 family protein [Bacillota bacterium]|nr:DUF3866 family protein [Bacillota bacterium]